METVRLRDQHAVVPVVIINNLKISRGAFHLLVLVDSDTIKFGFVMKGQGPYAFARRILVYSRTMPCSAVDAYF